jgi:SAM-dependent methyltransferase
VADIKASFTGSIPEYYDRCLGPAWFDAFAADLVQRLAAKPAGNVLEVACGTGLVTRRLRERLDPSVRLTATDLSKPMLDYARVKVGECESIEWQEADAARLPFGDGEFGAVVCAFGVMFVPDRQAAFSEARRVLKAGGTFLFNVWDRLEENPHAAVGAEVVEGLFPGDEEMRFRIPYEMHDPGLLRALLAATRFQVVRIEKKRIQIDRVSARTIATGQILGTPRSLLIEKRGVPLDQVVEKVAAALAKIGGADPYRAPAQAVVVEARAVA